MNWVLQVPGGPPLLPPPPLEAGPTRKNTEVPLTIARAASNGDGLTRLVLGSTDPSEAQKK